MSNAREGDKLDLEKLDQSLVRQAEGIQVWGTWNDGRQTPATFRYTGRRDSLGKPIFVIRIPGSNRDFAGIQPGLHELWPLLPKGSRIGVKLDDTAATMRTIRLVLPWDTLPFTTNQARRWHWPQRSRAAKNVRTATALVARQDAIEAMTLAVSIQLLWVVPDNRVRDSDAGSLVLKHAIDGLVDAGVLPGDHHKWVRESGCRIEVRRGESAVELLISEAS